jgi:precorrin-2 methylase
MKKILIIGIGAGNPEYTTIQALNACNQVDVFFILDKGIDKENWLNFAANSAGATLPYETTASSMQRALSGSAAALITGQRLRNSITTSRRCSSA